MTRDVFIFEMAPRDGLQNEPAAISTDAKVELVNLLDAVGLAKIEVASFVSPKWVPQMADGAEVLAGITRGNACYTALTPNLKGFERAIVAGVDEVAIFASASEGFSQANINCSISESLERFVPIMQAARNIDVPVRGYISCVAICPFDGQTEPVSVASLCEKLLAMGCYEVSLGDTIGRGDPDMIAAMLDAVLNKVSPNQLAGHFHNTSGQALANIQVSLDRGLRTFDASVGGLGGCPFAPGAAGNVATEVVVEMLEKQGFKTGIDRTKLELVAQFAKNLRKTE